MSEETFAGPGQQQGSQAPDADGPPTSGVVAQIRLAALMIDPDGRLTLWNRAAEELFGHRRAEVFDRPASGLLPLAGPGDANGSPGRLGDALDQLDDLTSCVPAWSGDLAVTDRDGRSVTVLCWSYRLIEPTGRSLLVLAADARRLRSTGPRLALGGRLLPYTSAAPATGLELAVSSMLLTAAGPAETARTAEQLAPLLPRTSADRRRRLLGQVAAAGAPGLLVDGTVRLPVLPYVPPEVVPHHPGDGRPAVVGAAPHGPGARPPDERQPAVPTPRSAPPGRPRRAGAEDGPFSGPPSVPTLTLSSADSPAAELPSVEPVNEQLRLLSHVGAQIGTTLDLDATVRELCDVVVPSIADFACVDLRDRLIVDTELPRDRPDDETQLRRVARTFSDSLAHWGRIVREGSLLALPRNTPSGLALQTNQPVLVPRVDRQVAEYCAAGRSGASLVPLFEGRSMLTLPLAARGTVLGILTLLRNDDRPPFDQADASYLRELAARAALSVDNARLHRMEAKTALTLQRSMLPGSPPKIPGVLIAHRYLPGDRRAEVGGDWFDAIQLPGSRVALVVGDVMGHGLHSAVAMGRFRTAMQTLAALDLPPGQILRHLDNLSQRLGDDHLATCLYAVYDPIARTCTIAGAGHVPPVLVHPDGRGELLEIPSGAPIGVGGVPFASREIKVSDGSMLVLCTDGLVEMRGGDIGDGLAALCGDIVDPRRSPDEVCDTVLERLHTDDRNDDLALLIARFDGIPPQDVMSWSLELDPEEVGRARLLVREQLTRWDLGELVEPAALLVSELVTNALRVARNRVELQLMRVGKLLVEVSDDDHNLPSLEPSEALDEDGRGLSLVSHLSARWGTSRKAVGKVVWFELPLPHRG
ncbi:SpoIIE family protein phosphatase [Streptacidiphilus sp. PB12-B1b]|uniref:SpoIIE family protein phosphatase n=1 Tax=Streptacidiphilus sp. PB12-B1b TaxID=2705012 RepID=UPI0015FB4129|nr:SpoIIE family protein phosphatase [Streptacidiphilus sp. PB12-B1b]QMU74439.1 SpoIIE family protein phosphatase [Streptacidiphilus sp. PB12-B1b]